MFHSRTYTCESVTIGHPDKICDQISDAILDECLRQDPSSRVAIECLGGHGTLMIAGELTSKAELDYALIARKTYEKIGYDDKLEIITRIVKQSPDIAMGVDVGGAGDQGIMYGYACDETPEYLPKAFVLAHRIGKRQTEVRQSNILPWLLPDGKAQVTVANGIVSQILVSNQHRDNVGDSDIRKQIIECIVKPVIGEIDEIEILINPTGRFLIGGFSADTGLTGRKIMVDTYGGVVSHGGGAFSGKDATKVDRSAAYMARFAAKNIVANKFAKECLVSVAYAIGQAEPMMLVAVDEKGNDISAILQKHFDFRPAAIRERLRLNQPIFVETAKNGHFNNHFFPWEEVMSL